MVVVLYQVISMIRDVIVIKAPTVDGATAKARKLKVCDDTSRDTNNVVVFFRNINI
jgi:hypothetical protein